MIKFPKLTFFLLSISILFSSSSIYAKDSLPEPSTWNNKVKQLLYDDTVKFKDGSNLMNLETPYRALDAAMVPITINFKENQTKENFVKFLTIIVDENPSPIVGKFEFSPKVGNASFSTRIRVDKYTYVRVIAEKSNGNKFMISNFVKAAGGCSAPSLSDMDAVMARLGKMKMKFIQTSKSSKLVNKAKFLISHPNYSGLQFNQLTRSEIPAHFINFVRIEQDGEMIIEASPDISLSENPSFTFNYMNSGGPIKVFVEDSEGQKFNGEFSSTQIVSQN